MNNRVDEENGKAIGMVKIWDQKVHQLSSDVFWNTISCLVSSPTFCIGGLSLWEK